MKINVLFRLRAMASLGAHKLKSSRAAFAVRQGTGDVPDRGVSQKVMGDYLGVSAMLVSYWENGHRMPGRKMAMKLQKLGIADIGDWDVPAPDVEAA